MDGMIEVCFLLLEGRVFIEKLRPSQPRDVRKRRGSTLTGLPPTVASTMGRPWFGLVRHSSILPLFHGHSNSGAFVVSQNAPI